ncbi:MAG: S8 family serine peptidase [Massilia sp.]
MLALTIAAGSASAEAQLRLPSVNLPASQAIGGFANDRLHDTASRLRALRELPIVSDVRLDTVGKLLRQHGDVLEADPRGAPAVRREILAWSPSKAGLAAARAAGLTVLRETRLEGLDEVMLVLQVPEHASTAALLEQLRALDPEGSYDFNHIYTGSGAVGAPAAPSGDATARKGGAISVGLVDSGVDASHQVFQDAMIERWGCDKPHPDQHGTAVAALMVGQGGDFRGVAPRASLFAADIYCDSGSGGSADKIAGALAWMAREKVGVINLSIVGPPNILLERVVGSMVKRGHLLVAAVGNDGPAAPPLYPASYPGVVGVSAVDKRGRVIPEAGRGPQVMFAAPGNNMVSAAVGDPAFRTVRGTSFASPIVAALLAVKLPYPDKALAAQAVSSLAKQARNEPGVASNETGLGVVGLNFRNDPSSFR